MAYGKYYKSGISSGNDLSRELSRARFKLKTQGPGVVQRCNWKLEWKNLGLDKKMKLTSYLKMKTNEWFSNKRKKVKGKKNGN